MPDLVIKKVEVYGKFTALPGSFVFANRNRILFKWNEEVGECPDGIIEVKDVILYLPWNTQKWNSDETSPSPQSRRSLSPKAVPKTPQQAMPTVSRLMLQEWQHC